MNSELINFTNTLERMRKVNKTLPTKLLIEKDSQSQFIKFYEAICKA
jgi:hypothetical protein